MIPEDDPTYRKNTNEQYEALGRFVESFEMMVNEVREMCVAFLAKDRNHQALVELPFHHQAMTAKPLFEILRGLIVEIVSASIKRQEQEAQTTVDLGPHPILDAEGQPLVFDIEERDTFLGVLTTIAAEYDALANMRNNLLHGTWFVGYVSADDEASTEFEVRKYTINKQGRSRLSLPTNAGQLRQLAERCDATRSWLTWVERCVTGFDAVRDCFINEGGKWKLVVYSGIKSTLT